MVLSITVTIIIITVLVSLFAFSSRKAVDDLIFYPVEIANRRQFYRFITYGFIHADLMHLIFNMYAFYLFGSFIEQAFIQLFTPVQGKVFYLLLYFAALIVSVIPDYLKYQNNSSYRSLGASGAVSAVIFAYIMIRPMDGIGIIFIPFGIPGFIFGILFIWVSYYLGKKGNSLINHEAHLWGAVFGIIFMIVFSSFFSDYPLLDNFILQVKNFKLDQLFQRF